LTAFVQALPPTNLQTLFSGLRGQTDSDPDTGRWAGRGGGIAQQSVFRIRGKYGQGTGFLHKSGVVITAGHVVEGGDTNTIKIISPKDDLLEITNVILETNLDLAILMPKKPINAQALPLGFTNSIWVGLRVSTWGFPGSYSGSTPLLTVGYIAGTEFRPVEPDPLKLTNDDFLATRRLVINATFNGGQSGSP